MFKIHNIIAILSFAICTGSVYAALDQNVINQPMANKSNIVKITETTQRININTADVVTLQKIKGFGKKKAEAIIEYRNKNGIFKSLEEILKIKVRGLNQKWLDKIGKFLTV